MLLRPINSRQARKTKFLELKLTQLFGELSDVSKLAFGLQLVLLCKCWKVAPDLTNIPGQQGRFALGLVDDRSDFLKLLGVAGAEIRVFQVSSAAAWN